MQTGCEVKMTHEEAIQHLENMKWLKGYSNTTVNGVPLGSVIDGIVALLKAQEPRLITNADFENNELVDSAESMPAWIEYRHGEEWDEYNDGNDDGWSVIYQFNFESEFYRCWTSRPTDRQRETTPWS